MLAAPESSKARRAALAIHALSTSERGRIMSHLTESARQNLLPLLKELEGLGIPRDARHVLSIVKPDGVPDAMPSAGVGAREIIRRLEAPAVASVMQGQSLATVRTILEAEEWPWRKSYLDRLPEYTRRELVTDREETPAAPRAFVDELLKEMVASLNNEQMRQPEARTPWWRRLLGRQ